MKIVFILLLVFLISSVQSMRVEYGINNVSAGYLKKPAHQCVNACKGIPGFDLGRCYDKQNDIQVEIQACTLYKKHRM